MAFKNLSVTVDEASVGRVDLVVRDLSELPRSQVRGLFDHDCVKVNGILCKDCGAEVFAGDLIAICFDPHTRYKERKRRWDDRTFSIVQEDDYLIVVDKSAGTLTVPTDNDDRNTLVDRVSNYLNHSRRNKVAWVVDRLDRDISGLLVFAKHESVEKALITQFKQQKPQREYAAIVAGVIGDDEGTLQSHLTVGKDLSVYSGPENRFSEEAVTRFKVIQRNADTTFVSLIAETRVRNQIRVQLSDAGHPVLGDPRYGNDQAQHSRWIRRRMALHVRTLSFVHPVAEKPVTYESPMPNAIQKFLSGSRLEKASTTDELTPWQRAQAARKAKE